MSTSTPGVSVIVCCYNSEARLPQTLRHLALQKVPEGLPWEVVVVDNASKDNTTAVAEKLWADFGSDVAFKVEQEPEPGLSSARLKGINTTRYDYMLFCDDDNWFCETYIARVFEIMEREKEALACGGLGEEAFEEGFMPPYWFERLKGSYALGPQAEKEGFVDSHRDFLYGAGLTIRRSAWEALLRAGFKSLLSDRKGNELTSGGDTELCNALSLLGKRLYYAPDLTFKHYMAAGRFTDDYLIRLYRGFGKGRVVLSAYTALIHGWYNPRIHNWRYQYYRHLFILARRFIPLSLDGIFGKVKLSMLRGKIETIRELKGQYDENFRIVAKLQKAFGEEMSGMS
jgi:glycosyltransferase involved in cell wall biosynthesis